MATVRKIDFEPFYHRLLAELRSSTITPLTKVTLVEFLADTDGKPLPPDGVRLQRERDLLGARLTSTLSGFGERSKATFATWYASHRRLRWCNAMAGSAGASSRT